MAFLAAAHSGAISTLARRPGAALNRSPCRGASAAPVACAGTHPGSSEPHWVAADAAAGLGQHRQRRAVAVRAKEGENAEQTLERRKRESAEVEERVTYIYDTRDWEQELAKAGDKLLVLEVQSQNVCQTGFDEEPELHWKADVRAAMEPCNGLKHAFARIARECQDVEFLSLEADSEDGSELCDQLGVEVLPTVQFWRGGEKLWEHRGVVNMQQDLGEGVLFYGDTGANNLKASTYVTDLRSRADLDTFVRSQPTNVLTVVNVALQSAAPCVHIFPAVLSLATNFVGYAAFGRLLADDLPDLMRELDIKQVPTFLFYRDGVEVSRHVGSSRADLIGQILSQQGSHGVQPPPPPTGAGGVRRTSRGRFSKMR